METLFIIISGRIYSELIETHLKAIDMLKLIFKDKFDFKIGLFLWEEAKIHNEIFKDKVDYLEYFNKNNYSEIGYIKMFQLQNNILKKYNDFDYFLRTRTDIIINRITIIKNNRYNSYKWARGITDNIGLANKNVFLKIWTNINEKMLKEFGPEIYLKKIIKHNNIKPRVIGHYIILFKSMTEKRRPGIRIWNLYSKKKYYKYINNLDYLNNIT